MVDLKKEINTQQKTEVKASVVDMPVIVNSSKSTGSKIRENPWIIASVVLALALIGILLFGGNNAVTGNVVNEATAKQNFMDFVAKQGVQAEVVSMEKEGVFYKVNVKVDGQEMPVYISTDGKYLVTSPISLTGITPGANPSANPSASSSPSQQAQPIEVPKSDKPKVELFVMSECPYGTQIEKGMIPVVELLKSKIDFEVKFVYYAMHGEKEVKEQLNQYCIQKEQNDKYLTYLKCYLKAGDGAACLSEVKISTSKLESCTKKADTEFNVMKNLADQASWLSGRFPKFDIYKADNEKYSIAGSPGLVINGAESSSGRDSASLLKAVCGAFNTAPGECSQTLSSTAPGPGFGYDAVAAAGASAGSCV